ncbi:hypothetical protein C8J56DRAFT_21495 [Mycena floridula]|nr:hypothetical protein C8J56DRAFT_21495 [Mycena floridula]
MDSPWDDDADEYSTADAEWTKMSSEFTNGGYREGITAGKESALQEGFDAGFAVVGAPIGRELGLLRGISSALIAYMSSNSGHQMDSLLVEARDIASKLGEIRFSDLAPRDLEAEEHARQHLDDEQGLDAENDELAEKRKLEKLEDMLAELTPGDSGALGRPTVEDVRSLKARLEILSQQIGIDVHWN